MNWYIWLKMITGISRPLWLLMVSQNKSFQIYQNVLYRIKKHLALNYNPPEDFEQLGGVA
jgi:hypothetical protein